MGITNNLILFNTRNQNKNTFRHKTGIRIKSTLPGIFRFQPMQFPPGSQVEYLSFPFA